MLEAASLEGVALADPLEAIEEGRTRAGAILQPQVKIYLFNGFVESLAAGDLAIASGLQDSKGTNEGLFGGSSRRLVGGLPERFLGSLG